MRKRFHPIFLSLLIVTGLSIAAIISLSGFNPGNRYDATRLYDMGVPFQEQSAIHRMSGFSAIHNGLDYFFNDGAIVIATAPGQVESINTQLLDTPGNRYAEQIMIRFNSSIIIMYGFEMWSESEVDLNLQISLFQVHVGDWVTAGTILATFIARGEAAHVHWGVTRNSVWQ